MSSDTTSGVGERLTLAQAAGQISESGYTRIPALFSADRVAALEAEAGDLYPSSERYLHDRYDIDAGTVVTSPATFRLASGGPALVRLWSSVALIRLLSQVVGGALTPTRCSYNYYEPGDHIGLHVDVDECQVTVTFGLWGVGPVLMYPQLRTRSPQELLALAANSGGEPDGGVPLAMTPGAAVVMTGSRTPHRRPIFDGALTGVGAMCYSVTREG